MHSLQEVEMPKTDARTDDMEVGRDGFKGRRLEVEDTGVLILAKELWDGCYFWVPRSGSLSNSDSRLAGVPMASPTLVPRFGGQSYRKLITAYPSLRV